MITRGLSVRWYLLFANGAALFLPLFAFFTLRIYDSYLLRQTERQLIAQGVVLGESFRSVWLKNAGFLDADAQPMRPPGRSGDKYTPYEPLIDLRTPIQSPQPDMPLCTAPSSKRIKKAAEEITPILKRSQVFNLTAIRILDAKGCVVASTGSELGHNLSSLSEVKQALQGRYGSEPRLRISDEPTPPLADLRRRGKVRIFSAVPVLHDGQVTAVIRLSRTSLSAVKSLFFYRKGLFWVAALSLASLLVISLLFSHAISKPLTRLTEGAEAFGRGTQKHLAPFKAGGPKEFQTLAAALERMTACLQEHAEYTRKYAADVSHELKTPITAIRGAAELLKHDGDAMSPEQRRRFLTNIERDALRMEALVSRLLTLARIEMPEHQNAPKRVESMPFFSQLAKRYPDRVDFSFQDPPQTLDIDPEHLLSAVTNLIENALEHGGPGHVSVRVGQTEGRLEVLVENSGPPISEANQKHIFERFFTTRRDEGGTGLGLAIVHAIVESQHGRIDFESNPNITRFCMVL